MCSGQGLGSGLGGAKPSPTRRTAKDFIFFSYKKIKVFNNSWLGLAEVVEPRARALVLGGLASLYRRPLTILFFFFKKK